MTDVRIRKCLLRVVRRGSWSWGREPRELAEAALRALPNLLAARLAGLADPAAPPVVLDRLRLRIRVKREELVELARLSRRSAALPDDHAVALRIAAQLETALLQVPQGFSPRERLPATTSPAAGSGVSPAQPAVPSIPHLPAVKAPPLSEALAMLLLESARSGRLEAWIAGFSEASLMAWIVALRAGSPPGLEEPPPACFSPEQQTAILNTRRLSAAPQVSRLARLRAALSLAVSLAPASSFGLSSRALWSFVFDSAGLATAAGTEAVEEPVLSVAAVQSHLIESHRASPPGAISRSRTLSRRVEYSEVAALPFLLIPALHHLGVLDVLMPALRAVRAAEHSSAWAAALAFKVLSPPARGWNRSDSLRHAAVFAGLELSSVESRVASLHPLGSAAFTPINALLTEKLVRAHTPRKPTVLLATDAPSGFLLLDSEGLAPIQWAPFLPSLFSSIAECGGPVALIPSDLLRDTYDSLTGSGFRPYVADDLLAEDALALWHSSRARPSLPRSVDSSAEMHFTLCAGAALGLLAWTLFSAREPSAPALILDRFHDLTAGVSLDEDRITLSLPLGRRRQDLARHGLLRNGIWLPWQQRLLVMDGG